jgi:hypothetical protein
MLSCVPHHCYDYGYMKTARLVGDGLYMKRWYEPDSWPFRERQQVMDISGIALAATEISQARTANAVQLAVLKEAMDIQAQAALQLVQAASQVMRSNPPNLGNQVDVFA